MGGRGVLENQKVKLHEEIRRNFYLRFSFFAPDFILPVKLLRSAFLKSISDMS